ncbi:MAG: hypothetical protein Q7S37_02910 [bacterium]|nr:hypothetical protein [bacterium]
MDGLNLFGTIIEWKGSKYVYLIEVGQITYLAKIIEDKEMAKKLIMRREFVERTSLQGDLNSQSRLNSPLYCFVILSTVDFEGALALLHKLGYDSTSAADYSNLNKLNEEDLEGLKEEIKENENSLPPEVVDYVKSLN